MKEDKKIKKSKKIGIFKENDEKRMRKMNIIATVESLYKFGRRLKMMKYTFPYFEIVEFEEEDIVVTSGTRICLAPLLTLTPTVAPFFNLYPSSYTCETI